MGIHFQEAQRPPLKINKNRSKPQHIILKLENFKDKVKILKGAWGNRSFTSKGRHMRLATDLSAETQQTRKGWYDTFNVLTGKKIEPRLMCPARLSLRTEGEIKSFQDNQNRKNL